jgi:hypothetical protein
MMMMECRFIRLTLTTDDKLFLRRSKWDFDMGSRGRFATSITDTEDDRERQYRRALDEIAHFDNFESFSRKVVEFFGPVSE